MIKDSDIYFHTLEDVDQAHSLAHGYVLENAGPWNDLFPLLAT